MYKFAILLTLFTGDVEEHHAYQFLNEQNCWQWVWMFNAGLERGHTWLGRCMPMEEFRREHPDVRIEGES